MRYIDANKKEYGIEPICQVLEVAQSTYYDRQSRPISARRLNDARLKREIERVHKENFEVYGMEKMWLQLNKEQIAVGRDQVRRLMREMGIDGVVRGKTTFTTVPGDLAQRPADLVNREFKAPAPNRLWVADLSYVWTRAGFVYVALVTDVFSRFIVGWRVSTSLHSELALDALEMALWNRRHQALDGLVHHSDRGVQYLAIRYTDRLEEAGAIRSVGSKGDSYDNALAESVNGLYKTELIKRRGPWRNADHVEAATAEWVRWWNHKRIHTSVDNMPPAEYEERYYKKLEEASDVA